MQKHCFAPCLLWPPDKQRRRDASARTQSRSAHRGHLSRPLTTHPKNSGASLGPSEACGMDETRNCGEINRELLLRPEAGVVLGRAVRRCRPTARFVRFPRPEAADPNRRTYRRASPRETKSGAPIVVANLLPTHDRGPGPPGGRSTWLLLSPNLSSATAMPGVIPFDGERSRHRGRQHDRS